MPKTFLFLNDPGLILVIHMHNNCMQSLCFYTSVYACIAEDFNLLNLRQKGEPWFSLRLLLSIAHTYAHNR